ncbi:disease resistance protein RGA2-like [Typha latifolia]|uniref:disease resistance protein RGA2-like n=1 Tax=Typha latifolia TaxID=4733 RepID=UPI003C2E125E
MASVAKLITALVSYLNQQHKIQLGLKDELEMLENALPKIQELLDAMDHGNIEDENPVVGRWLWKLRDATYEADDLVDELEYYRLEQEIEVSDRRTITDTFLQRLKNAMRGLVKVASSVDDFFELVDILRQQQQQQQQSNRSNRDTSSLLIVETRVFGRDNNKEEIINKLLSFKSQCIDRKFSIMPVIGDGGIGKTTLAQLVYNDVRTKDHFGKRMWVCVSNAFDQISLAKKIYESALGEKTDFDNLDEIHWKLSEELKSKRVLLVLDDVWSDDDRICWDEVLAPFQLVESGSVIMLTTRIKAVGKMMGIKTEPFFLQGLSGDDYWQFFKQCAFRYEDPTYHKKLEKIGKKIVKKLSGSPLAAETVGGILNQSLDEQHWKDVLDGDIWELQQCENDYMPALRLSYQNLPSHLKPCITYCTTFPKGYEFDKDDLVYMWMALGLVEQPTDAKRRPEDEGYDYFNHLLEKSFFYCKTCDSHSYYVMNNQMYDLAQFVSQSESSGVMGNMPKNIPKTVRHLSVDISKLSGPEISDLKNLRALFLYFDRYHPELHVDIHEKLKGLKNLRVLKLSARCLHTFPDCIGDFIHLRYLNLDDTAISHLPVSVNKLYHLQVMSITPAHHGCMQACQLKHLNGLDNLINLRHLIMPWKLFCMIDCVGRLTSLQNLDIFCVAKEDGHKISELRDLGELRELGIQNLENVTRIRDVIEVKLSDKKYLHTMRLEWVLEGRTGGSCEFDEQVLDFLKPCSDLKVLKISGYMGRRRPLWMTTQSLYALESIVLSSCNGWADLSPLEQLPCLNSLCLENMHAVQSIGYQSNGVAGIINFPQLQVLVIHDLPVLEELYGGAGATQWFPCLTSLRVSGCPKLRLLNPLPCSLKELSIQNVAWVALPKLKQNGKNNCSSSSLSTLRIASCPSLASLAEGLFARPENFTTLEDLTILNCPELKHLPVQGFRKLVSLKKLVIKECPKLEGRTVSESFLPQSIQFLVMASCGDLDAALPKGLEKVTDLIELELKNCANITSLASIEALGRWKKLQKLWIENCRELASLEGLQVMSNLKDLKIRGCSKLPNMTI